MQGSGVKTTEPSEVVCVCAVRVQTGPEAGPRPCGASLSGSRCFVAACRNKGAAPLGSSSQLRAETSALARFRLSGSSSFVGGDRDSSGPAGEAQRDLLATGGDHRLLKVKVLRGDVTTNDQIFRSEQGWLIRTEFGEGSVVSAR